MVEHRDRLRFEVPLYTVMDAARIVDVPVSTLLHLGQGVHASLPRPSGVVGDPIVTYMPPAGPRRPSIPFGGLTEATALAAIRSSGVSMQRSRPALCALRRTWVWTMRPNQRPERCRDWLRTRAGSGAAIGLKRKVGWCPSNHRHLREAAEASCGVNPPRSNCQGSSVP